MRSTILPILALALGLGAFAACATDATPVEATNTPADASDAPDNASANTNAPSNAAPVPPTAPPPVVEWLDGYAPVPPAVPLDTPMNEAVLLALEYPARAPFTLPEVPAPPTPTLRFPFHARHGDVVQRCTYCHPGAVDDTKPMRPSENVCATCHSEDGAIDRSTPDGSCAACHASPDHTVVWKPVYPFAVKMDHVAHDARGVRCDACHTDVEEVEGDSFFAAPTMAQCLDCHEHTDAIEDCRVCHDTLSDPSDVVRANVAFTHDAHLELLGTTSCGECHTHAEAQGVVIVPGDAPDMAACVSCHIERGADLACASCHQDASVVPPAVSQRAGLNFSHTAHLEAVACRECHTSVTETGTMHDARDMPMPTCIGCHLERDLAITCGTCHAQDLTPPPTVERDAMEFSHETHVGDLAQAWNVDARKMQCAECHLSIGQHRAVIPGDSPDMQACMECHAERERANDCRVCHATNTPSEEGAHSMLQVMRHAESVALTYEGRVRRCAECHTETFCASCHEQTVSHTAFFRQTGHRSATGAATRECATCHKDEFCRVCHESVGLPD